MFTYAHTVKLHETDAAGRLFFSHQFSIIYDAYEALFEKMGFSFSYMLRKTSFFLPIVHAEATYKKPLFVGDRLIITIRVAHIGTTSFTFSYQIFNVKEVLVGTAKTVHVTISQETNKKIPLPPKMRLSLKKWVK